MRLCAAVAEPDLPFDLYRSAIGAIENASREFSGSSLLGDYLGITDARERRQRLNADHALGAARLRPVA